MLTLKKNVLSKYIFLGKICSSERTKIFCENLSSAGSGKQRSDNKSSLLHCCQSPLPLLSFSPFLCPCHLLHCTHRWSFLCFSSPWLSLFFFITNVSSVVLLYLQILYSTTWGSAKSTNKALRLPIKRVEVKGWCRKVLKFKILAINIFVGPRSNH